jgi:hypothetical protein
MNKKQMIAAIKSAGVSNEYAKTLEAMTEEEVRTELQELGRAMKD